jgi:phage tail sheath protein FI
LLSGERDALGFTAMYHGWLTTRDDDGELRSVAPDGVASGVIARRAIARGAWLAPANEPLSGVIALSRPSTPNRLIALQDAGINVVLHAPRGFTVMCADTLSPDDEVRPINVRRLLILLRRQSLRLGTTYVFEPNDDSFRRMVQRGFEAMLAGLFERGAFAGDTTATAFQVRTDSSLNTSASIDQGRFIVELRVAPARPMTFVTIRLVQTGERLVLTGA